MTTQTDSILVLGATGKTGGRLVRTLRAAGKRVRAASRSGEVRFDWADQSTWPAALDGASAVYLVAPENPALARIFVQQAAAAGVGRFVALSGRGIEQVPPEPFKSVIAAEQAVRESGAEWSIIRPNNFNQNFDEACGAHRCEAVGWPCPSAPHRSRSSMPRTSPMSPRSC
ncbi:NAD(P)H-binding protein [Saccharopolyspora sp. NPDC050389]|uniref:SDR family oxidoreductase n=1 Tax=Saccharopolyspora sp. NPDC050389 TaxID=3155516 RepID=UPI0033D0EE28